MPSPAKRLADDRELLRALKEIAADYRRRNFPLSAEREEVTIALVRARIKQAEARDE